MSGVEPANAATEPVPAGVETTVRHCWPEGQALKIGVTSARCWKGTSHTGSSPQGLRSAGPFVTVQPAKK